MIWPKKGDEIWDMDMGSGGIVRDVVSAHLTLSDSWTVMVNHTGLEKHSMTLRDKLVPDGCLGIRDEQVTF